tara:strand:+ start:281 stop:508 length:228 start_codon:yes stop_codon:yes gene_type:complete
MKRGNLGSNLLNKTTHTLDFKTNKIKKKPTKKRTVTSTDEQWENLRALSVLVLGVENRSGLINYMITKLDKEVRK